MENAPFVGLTAVYLYGFVCASIIVWKDSEGAAGLAGLIAAVLWPIWLPWMAVHWQETGWSKRYWARVRQKL